MKVDVHKLEVELAKNGYTYSGFAEKAGLSVNGFMLIRQRGEATPRNVGRIADALGVPVEKIVAKEG